MNFSRVKRPCVCRMLEYKEVVNSVLERKEVWKKRRTMSKWLVSMM